MTPADMDMEPEYVPAYSSGAFLNVLDHDVAGWQRRVAFLRTLTGLTHVEVWLENVTLGPAERAELLSLLSGYKLIVHGPYLQLSMISHHDVVRGACAEVYRRTMAAADDLHAEIVTFPGGARPFFLDEDLALEQVAAMYAELQHGGCRARPVLKNMPVESGITVVFPASLSDLQRNMDRVPDLQVTLDVGYCVQNRDNWIAFLRSQHSRIANIHLHDAQPDGGGHQRLGTGAMDAFALARLLRAVGYTGYVSLGTVGQKDTMYSWKVWRHAQAEASQETTATVSSAEVSRIGASGDGAGNGDRKS